MNNLDAEINEIAALFGQAPVIPVLTPPKPIEDLDELRQRAAALIGEPQARPIILAKSKPESKSRLHKCECTECGYIVRTTRIHLDKYGAPICPCNRKVMLTKFNK